MNFVHSLLSLNLVCLHLSNSKREDNKNGWLNNVMLLRQMNISMLGGNKTHRKKSMNIEGDSLQSNPIAKFIIHEGVILCICDHKTTPRAGKAHPSHVVVNLFIHTHMKDFFFFHRKFLYVFVLVYKIW